MNKLKSFNPRPIRRKVKQFEVPPSAKVRFKGAEMGRKQIISLPQRQFLMLLLFLLFCYIWIVCCHYINCLRMVPRFSLPLHQKLVAARFLKRSSHFPFRGYIERIESQGANIQHCNSPFLSGLMVHGSLFYKKILTMNAYFSCIYWRAESRDGWEDE